MVRRTLTIAAAAGFVLVADNASALTLECTFASGAKAYETIDNSWQVTNDQFIQEEKGSVLVISRRTLAFTIVGAINTNGQCVPVALPSEVPPGLQPPPPPPGQYCTSDMPGCPSPLQRY